MTLYGIPNCDTVKRARAWLAAQGMAHVFHDFKKAGVPPDRLDAWLHAAGWQALVNRGGSTWRKLGDAERAAITDAITDAITNTDADAAGTPAARALLLAQPSAIKRPVVEWDDGALTVGFDSAHWHTRTAGARPPQA